MSLTSDRLFLWFLVQRHARAHRSLLICRRSKEQSNVEIEKSNGDVPTFDSCFISRVNASHSTSILSTYSTFLTRASRSGSSKNPSGSADTASAGGADTLCTGVAALAMVALVCAGAFEEPVSKKSEIGRLKGTSFGFGLTSGKRWVWGGCRRWFTDRDRITRCR